MAASGEVQVGTVTGVTPGLLLKAVLPSGLALQLGLQDLAPRRAQQVKALVRRRLQEPGAGAGPAGGSGAVDLDRARQLTREAMSKVLLGKQLQLVAQRVAEGRLVVREVAGEVSEAGSKRTQRYRQWLKQHGLDQEGAPVVVPAAQLAEAQARLYASGEVIQGKVGRALSGGCSARRLAAVLPEDCVTSGHAIAAGCGSS